MSAVGDFDEARVGQAGDEALCGVGFEDVGALAADQQGGALEGVEAAGGVAALGVGAGALAEVGVVEEAVGLADVASVGALDEVVAGGALDVFAGAERVVGDDAVDELVELVELSVADDEVADGLRAALGDFGADVDEGDGAGQGGLERGEAHRDHAAHRVSDDDGGVDLLLGEQGEGVAGHGFGAVFGVAGPLAVAVAALVEGVDVEAVGEVEGDEVPGVGGLVAAVEEEEGRVAGVAPFEQVEAEVVGDDVAGDIAEVWGVGDAEVGGALEQAGELVGLGHVDGVGGRRKGVEVHGRSEPWHAGADAPGRVTIADGV